MPGRDLRPDQFEDRRYPLHLPLRFRAYRGPALVKSGEGETLSIGVRDVLFSTTEAPYDGLVAQLSIDWPVLLDGRTPLQLCIFGEIVSCREEHVLVRIMDHELKLKPTLAKGVGR